MQTVGAYQKNVKIAERHVTVRIVVGKNVVVGIKLLYQIKISLAVLLQDVLILYVLQKIVLSRK